MSDTKTLKCPTCQNTAKVGRFAKNTLKCDKCDGIMGPIKAIKTEEQKTAEQLSNKSHLEPGRFKVGQKVKVLPHDFVVSGVKCNEPGFIGYFESESGPDATHGDILIRVRKDKGGAYYILGKHVSNA